MPGGAHEFMKAWEPEEDQIIMEMHSREGPKWKLIVKKLPGRTVSSVRNRWQRIEKGRKLREEGHELKNRCHACGQPKRGHICQAKLREVTTKPDDDIPLEPKLVPPPTVLDSGGRRATSTLPPSLAMPAGVSPIVGQITSGGRGDMSGAPMVRRTRSASKLVPPDDRARASGGLPVGVDVQSASAVAGIEQHGIYNTNDPNQPDLQRSNTSFFKSLANAGLFSPSSADMLAGWGDSPSFGPGAVPRLDVAAVADDPAAPPSLRRIASNSLSGQNEGNMEPRVTRTISSYLRDTSSPMDAQGGLNLPASSALLPDGPSSALPMLSRQGSRSSRGPSRQNSTTALLGGQGADSFMRDLFDVSAKLEAPPPELLPPGYQPPVQPPELGKEESFNIENHLI